MQQGKFYLLACPFFWTFVGRYHGHLNFQELVLADAIYFTRPGRTFDTLCTEGLILRGDGKSSFVPILGTLCLADGTEVPRGVIVPAQGPKFQWTAPTPWVK